MIVATANNRIIGKDNEMPWHLPADLKYFKQTTLNKPVIMGRKTYESIGKALPNRRNIVISRDATYSLQDADVVNSIEQAIDLVSKEDEVMIIGGGTIYQYCLPFAERLYVTHIDLEVDGDTQFPAYDTENQWQLISEQHFDADEKNPHNYCFSIYERQ